MSDPVSERYKKAAAFSPQRTEQAQLARLLISAQMPAYQAPYGGLHNTPNGPNGLPAFEQPGSSLPIASYMPAPQERPGPTAAPAAAPPQPAPAPAPMPAALPDMPATPMPDPTQPPQQPQADSIRADLMAALAAFRQKPGPWAMNQGNLKDQTG